MTTQPTASSLEKIGDRYRAAYVAHDPRRVPISASVRFTENNIEMGTRRGSCAT